MMNLHSLNNTTRPHKRRKLLGRGVGSKHGKTSCRGHKGAGSRSGWKSRSRYEGGQLPLYRKLPERGFSNVRFARKLDVINLETIEKLFEDGEVVSIQTLRQKGFVKGASSGIKILGRGDLTKKVTIEAQAVSAGAKEKLESAKISYRAV